MQQDLRSEHGYRFKIISAGRRSGKTEIAKRYVSEMAMRHQDRRYFIASPTRPQTKEIYWEDMMALLHPFIQDKSLTDLKMKLITGSEIQLFGLGGSTGGQSSAARMEGRPWHGGVVDEYANCPPGVFEHHIRPALSETGGFCWFVGVPEGRNHYYDFHLRGLTGDPDWKSYTWFSSDIMDPVEVEAAKKDMDERTFRQEYEGSFESYEGQLYYAWDRNKHLLDLAEDVVDPALPLILSCDFNKSPMAWVVAQLHGSNGRSHLKVLPEIVIPHNAKTQTAAWEFINRFKDHPNKVVTLTGDASNKYESHRDFTTDYVIIRDSLQQAGWKVVERIPKANPNINNRVNVVCSLLQHSRITISPRCHYLVNDLERNESDGKGGKLKTDPQQTHASDALDYMIWLLFSGEFYKNQVRQL